MFILSQNSCPFLCHVVQCFWYLIRDEARPIVEKHKTYALYRPSADVFASIITELPTKVCVVLSFNLIFCFMANFNRRTGSFSFFYLLVNFIATISMSHLFITAATTSLSEAMTPVSVLFWICLFLPVLLSQLQICTAGVVGSTILIQLAMLLKVYLLMSFHGRSFECSQFIPSGPGHPTSGKNVICSPVSSVPSRSYVLGDDYIYVSYKYKWAHAWRN